MNDIDIVDLITGEVAATLLVSEDCDPERLRRWCEQVTRTRRYEARDFWARKDT